ncbi:hypothetical protein N7540_002775 [Penicillium herquei]|nr:hypothetical protein N7540_002775 [Penicillium herquei]
MVEGSPVAPGSQSSSKQRGQACERCWKRKQKCDRALPACTACAQINAECVPRKFAIEPISNGGGSLSHAAIPSYLNNLKRKRDELTEQIQRRRTVRPRNITTEVLQAPRSPSSPSRHEHGPSGQESTEHTVQAAMGEIGFLSHSAMAEPRDEKSNFSEALTMGRMVRAAMALSGATPSQSSVDPYMMRIASMSDSVVDIGRDLAAPFFTTFLQTRGSQFLHIDLNDLRADFDTIFNNSPTLSEGINPIPDSKAFVVYMYVATGVLVSQESGALQGLAGALYRKASKLLPAIMKCGNRIEILNCMLALALYSMQSPQGGSTWHLVGLAMKKAIAFRFHNDPDSLGTIPSLVLLMRRNIFWSLYTIDRTISMIMDRPFNIEDDEITVPVSVSPGVTESQPYPSETYAIQNQSPEEYMDDSSVRDGASNSVLFHFSNISYWRDSFRSTKGQAFNSNFSQKFAMQLSSRAMVEILKSTGSTHIEPSMIHDSQAITKDIITACSEYIEDEYRSSERGEFSGGFVEGYDIFTAGVIICLAGGSPNSFADLGIQNKCTALLTAVGERFVGLRVFRRVLWALSDAVSGNPKIDSIIHEIPPMIPDGIKGLIAERLRLVSSDASDAKWNFR